MNLTPLQPAPQRNRLRNVLFAAGGVVCVGLGALGVLLPGLPTTIFLIAASYLFTRSCPYLEQRLIRNRFFAPFVRYLDEPAEMPFRAKVITIAVMWTFVTLSTVVLARNASVPVWVVVLPAGTAVIGTWVVARLGREKRRARLAEMQATLAEAQRGAAEAERAAAGEQRGAAEAERVAAGAAETERCAAGAERGAGGAVVRGSRTGKESGLRECEAADLIGADSSEFGRGRTKEAARGVGVREAS